MAATSTTRRRRRQSVSSSTADTYRLLAWWNQFPDTGRTVVLDLMSELAETYGLASSPATSGAPPPGPSDEGPDTTA